MPFNDWTLMGGPAVSLSKGDHALSLSLLAPAEDWSQTDCSLPLEGSTIEASTDGSNDYYLGDIRYHTSASDNLSWFVGYKIGFNSWKDRVTNDAVVNGEHDKPIFEEEGNELSHGPIFGSNISFPFETAGLPLAIWGSVAYGPLMMVHEEVDVWFPANPHGTPFIESSSTSFDNWYINSEVGVRSNITENFSFNLGYRNDIWGYLDEGPWVSIGGPSLTFSYNW